MSAQEVATLRQQGYDPAAYYRNDASLRQVLDMLASGYFCPDDPARHRPVVDALLQQGDHFMLLADYASYVASQEEVGRVYRDPQEWTRRAILNVAGMGKFSSDRTIGEYARHIWQATAVAPAAPGHVCD